MPRDPHCGPVPEQAWHADSLARQRGRVEMFNATRADGLDGWTMDLGQYEQMRTHILEMIDDHADADGTIALRAVLDAAQERYGTHPLFPGGRTRNYCTFTKVDLEARCEIERIPGSSPQRIRRPNADDDGAAHPISARPGLQSPQVAESQPAPRATSSTAPNRTR